MPAKPIMDSFSPVLPNALFGIGIRVLVGCSACARGSRIRAELINPAAVPAFKNSRLSITSSGEAKHQNSVIIGFFIGFFEPLRKQARRGSRRMSQKLQPLLANVFRH